MSNNRGNFLYIKDYYLKHTLFVQNEITYSLETIFLSFKVKYTLTFSSPNLLIWWFQWERNQLSNIPKLLITIDVFNTYVT